MVIRLCKWFLSIAILGITFLSNGVAAERTLLVSAATSLTNVLQEIGAEFQKQHPNIRVQYNFAASGVLLQQMKQQAPVDLLITADEYTMQEAQKLGLIANNTRFNWLSNRLVLITAKSSTLSITRLHDLRDLPIQYIAIGNPKTTPNGRYAQATLEQAGLWKTLSNKMVYAANVRQGIDYVRRSEAQVGFAFQTDAQQFADSIRVILTVPTVTWMNGQWQPKSIVYPVAQVSYRSNRDALRFIEFLRQPQSIAIAQRYGFISFPLQNTAVQGGSYVKSQ